MANPTKGIRVAVVEDGEGQTRIQVVEREQEEYGVHVDYENYPDNKQRADVDVTYINWLIETDEKRREHLEKLHAGGQDVLVDMGNMTHASIENIPLDADYESMVEDMLQGFNHVVMQGITPIRALYAMSQAFAIVLGYALRANMPWPVAQAILTTVMKSANAAEKMVRHVTRQ